MFNLLNAFPGQEEQEVVFILARPYYVAFLPTAFIFIFIFGLSALFQLAVLGGYIPGLTSTLSVAIILFLGLFELFVLIVFLTAVFDFYYDILIATDRRVIDITQDQLLFRSISELNLEDVEDVHSEVGGFFQTLLDYGNITIQTAGERENFIAKNFRHPREIAAIISDLSQQAKNSIPDGDRIPTTHVKAIINNDPVPTFDALCKLGGVDPHDPRTKKA